MNSFLFSAITLCLAAQCALANYQSSGYGQQRKLAPMPQTYGQASYSSGEQHHEASGSQYEERAPAASYGAPRTSASYSRAQPQPQQQHYQQQSAGYGAQQVAASSSYAKPAAKYEEPYYPPMPFAWGYDINDGYGGAQYHKETGDEYGKRTGSYGYTDAYGIYRQVDYVADEHGFRATIKTNEPGTANESPADVELHAYEPPSNFYAGNTNSYAAGSGSGNSYSSSNGAQSYAAAPAQRSSAYAASQQSAYSARPAASSYSQQRPAASAGYSGAKQQARPYDQSAQYSSSVLVPVYQRAAVAPKQSAAKRY